MRRLSAETLEGLPDGVATPLYDRRAIRIGVVHIGLGAFHRAHQAAIFDAALAAGDTRWGIVGVSLRSAAVRDQLVPQDGLYTLVEADGETERQRVIGAIRDVLVAPEDPSAVIAALAHPDVHLVTLTITEKGYARAGDRLDESDPDVAHDLADLSAPRTAAGFLVAGLAARKAAGLVPFTAISCDNLPHNGQVLRRAVLCIARAHDADLADWIERHGAFPPTMVDRIVPATSDADIVALAGTIGVEDRGMVKTEPFLQWVIEDRFCGPRPAFEALGVRLAQDIAPWEEAKLRLLNGAHSAIAYLGGLAGVGFVHEFVALPEGRMFVEMLWDEAQATLNAPPGLDFAAYRQALMRRFANSALRHRTRQIAMDGSQKLPQRLVAPIGARLDRGQGHDALSLAVAAWMRWQGGVDDAGNRFAIDDPMAEKLGAAVKGARTTGERVDALLAMEGIFPSAWRDRPVRDVLIGHLARLEAEGALATLRRLLAGRG